MKIVLVIDFDGTITDEDFFAYLKEAFLEEDALEPWQLYLNGELSHFNALKNIFGTLRVSENELQNLINTVKVDPEVYPLFELCHNLNMPIYIASAGCNYYINKLIGEEINKYGITLITNPSSYSQSGGLKMDMPSEDDLFYHPDTGISKRKVVEILQEQDYRVIFAGDGPPDIEPARIADVVFARKMLLEKCLQENIKTETFNSCADIYTYIKEQPK